MSFCDTGKGKVKTVGKVLPPLQSPMLYLPGLYIESLTSFCHSICKKGYKGAFISIGILSLYILSNFANYNAVISHNQKGDDNFN
jgi:hypothetical protein